MHRKKRKKKSEREDLSKIIRCQGKYLSMTTFANFGDGKQRRNWKEIKIMNKLKYKF